MPGNSSDWKLTGSGGSEGRAAIARLRAARAILSRLGAAPYLAIPERNAAERQIARFEEGASLAEIYAEQGGVPVRG